jgi:hypothetical protein
VKTHQHDIDSFNKPRLRTKGLWEKYILCEIFNMPINILMLINIIKERKNATWTFETSIQSLESKHKRDINIAKKNEIQAKANKVEHIYFPVCFESALMMKTNSGFKPKGMATTLISICWFEWVKQDLYWYAYFVNDSCLDG